MSKVERDVLMGAELGPKSVLTSARLTCAWGCTAIRVRRSLRMSLRGRLNDKQANERATIAAKCGNITEWKCTHEYMNRQTE